MRIQIPAQRERGIALMMVLIVVTVLTILAGKFAYQMKVETQLARNASFEADYEWAGRSGIERAKWILALSSTGPGAQMDTLMQKWAGGPGGLGDSNSPLADIELKGYKLSEDVTIDLEIEDHDRKFNINVANELLLKQALTDVVGVEEGTLAETIAQSIEDWIDPDDKPRMSGAESSTYQNMTPPYFCKDGPMDDISELLMIQGVSPAMYYGSGGGHVPTLHQMNRGARQSRFEEVTYAVGLKDLFTTTSSRLVNINTAPAEVLRMIPGIDETGAQAIIAARANGPDRVPGTPDDGGISPAALGGLPGVPPQVAAQSSGFFTSKSLVFEVKVDVTAGGMKRRYVGLLRRNSPRDVQVLSMYWE